MREKITIGVFRTPESPGYTSVLMYECMCV